MRRNASFRFISQRLLGLPVAIAAAIICACLPAWAADEPRAEAAPTTPTLTRVRLKPVIKSKPAAVRLEPVLKSPAEEPKKTGEGKIPAASGAPELKPPAASPVPKPPAPISVAPAPPSVNPTGGAATPGAAPAPAPKPLAPKPAAAQLLAQAKEKLAAGSSGEALSLLKTIVRDYPQSTEAPEALLLAAGMNSDLDAALRELNALTAQYPSTAAAVQAYSRIGEFSFILGRYEEAVKAFQAYQSQESDPVKLKPITIKLAMALLLWPRYDEAARQFDALLIRYPDLAETPQILEGLADSRMALGEVGRASELYDKIDRKFPNYEFAVKLLMSRGLCAELIGETAKAAQLYDTIVKNYPKSLEAGIAAARFEDVSRPFIPAAPAN